MDDIFCDIDHKSKPDSIVMRLLRSAMDKAHEKVQSKDGPIEFLHERSKFYELAAILVEGGLNIVQEETGSVEDNRDKILSDLMEIRHWLRGRIKDMKDLIIDKDRELTQRLENESKLRHALELKEKELVCLYDRLDPGRVKNEHSATEEDICELKNSLDQQVLNIKQKLEDENKSLTNEAKKMTSHLSSPDFISSFIEDKEISESFGIKEKEVYWDDKFARLRLSRDSSRPEHNTLIRWMSSDLDDLKETLDLAFGRMRSAELLPLEKQWRWTIEKDIESLLVKDFTKDLQQSFELELNKRTGLLMDDWLEFIDEMRALCHELKSFCMVDEKRSNNFSSFHPIRRTNSEPLLDIDYQERLLEEVIEDDESHYVSKLIKNRESIIRKQGEGWEFMSRQVHEREKTECSNSLGKRIEDAIRRLDNFVERRQNLQDKMCVSNRSKTHRKRIPMPERKTETKKITCCEDLDREVRKLKTSLDDLALQILLMEDTNQAIFQSLVKEIAEAWKFERDSCALENHIREDIYQFLILEAVKNRRIHSRGSKSFLPFDLSDDTPRSRKTEGDERIMEKLDTLTKCLEAEEDLMLRASSEIKERSAKNDLVILDCEETEERNAIEWLLTDEECTFSSVGKKLEGALKQLNTSKDLVVEMEQSLELYEDDFEENVFDLELNNILTAEQEAQHSYLDKDDDEFVEKIPSNTVFLTIIKFQQVLLDFDMIVNKNLDMKCQRLEALGHRVHMLVGLVALIRNRKLLYKKAFISRCRNLQLAESEVDLLGDQVDNLLHLLEKIYFVLNKNAIVLSPYFEVSQVLKLIRSELIKIPREPKY